MSVYVEMVGKYVHSKWCPACDAEHSMSDSMREAHEKQLKIDRIINRHIPELYQDAQLSHIQPEILAHVQSKQPGQGLYIWGDVGRGKTYMASALMRQCIEQGKMARRAALKDIIDKIQDTFSNRESYGSPEMIYQQLIRPHLLCLEDIGTGTDGRIQSDFNQDVLLKLVDRRLEAKKTTVITSNLSPENLCNAFGTRIYSRISTFLIIELKGVDRRSSK
jgi:DNA replication protein DnaC